MNWLRWVWRRLFCRHDWDQRGWLGNESAWWCLKCGCIEYRKTPGGPPPPGVAFGPSASE